VNPVIFEFELAHHKEDLYITPLIPGNFYTHRDGKMAASGGKKLGKLVKGMKKTVEKVIHPPFLKTNIPAGQASPAPPLGTQLGQVCQ